MTALILRESNAGHLWLDDGTIAIHMNERHTEKALAEADMRLYANGDWDVNDVHEDFVVASDEVEDIPEVARFDDDVFTVTASHLGVAASLYIGDTDND